MKCCGRERGKKYWIKRAIFIPIAVVAGVFIFGNLVMYLWNAILPEVFGLHTITFWQAIGILVLSKVLFGGFAGGHGHHRCHRHGQEMRERWMNLSPEEKEKMKAEWKCKCESTEKQE